MADQVDSDLDSMWKLTLGLDLEGRSVLEAEVLMWRICSAKHLSAASLNRAIQNDWESET